MSEVSVGHAGHANCKLKVGPENPEPKTTFQDRVMVWGMVSLELTFYATAVFESI